MSRGVFRSQNKVGETWSFQTVVTSASTFNPFVTFLNSARVSWDIGESSYFGGNNLSHVFSDNGDVKTITIRTYYGGISDIYTVFFYSNSIYGHVNISGFTNLGGQLRLDENSRINKITNPISPNSLMYVVNGLPLDGSDQYGTVDMSTLTGITNFSMAHRPKVTQIINPITTIPISNYTFSNNGSYPVTGVTGTLNISGLTSLSGNFMGQQNPNLTKILSPVTNGSFYYYNLVNCNLTGNHDISGLNNLGGQFLITNNGNLTGITHCYTPQVFTHYYLDQNNITGNHNMSMIPNLGGIFSIYGNPNLTSITHTASTQSFSYYAMYSCNLTGNHNMTMFPNFSGQLTGGLNPNLTSVTHTASTGVIIGYSLGTCNITGNHDLSMFTNLGGIINMAVNPNLTGMTFSYSPELITFSINNCNLMGNFDLSVFPNLRYQLTINSNPNLTGITHTASTQNINGYLAYDCDITGVHDLSMFPNLNTEDAGINFRGNTNLTGVIFPLTTKTFKNPNPLVDRESINLSYCNLDYVNFLPLSGATFNSNWVFGVSIILKENNMTSADVNHILTDFDYMANANPTKWSGVTLNILTNNSAPDTTSGGYNGIVAINSLTGSPKNWIIT